MTGVTTIATGAEQSGADEAGLGARQPGVFGAALRTPLGLAGAIMIAVTVIAGVGAPLLAPQSPTAVNFGLEFQQVGTIGYLLGTDDLGRDILSRALFGMRASLEVGLLAVLLAVVGGTALGLLAGYYRWLDAIIARIADVTLAFPFLILGVGLAAIYGPSGTVAAIAIGVSQVPVMLRVVRAETMRVKGLDFITNARAMDASGPRILATHILPNVASPVIVQATVILPVAVISEAILSYLGLGNQPPQPSLGSMLSDAQAYMSQAPFAALLPGIAIAVMCLGFNLFGDALSDALDPTNRRR